MSKKPTHPTAPHWVRQELGIALNGIDPTDKDTVVAAIAMLGEKGYDFVCHEQTTNFDPNEYGPMMLEGYNMVAGAGLAKILQSVHAATSSDQHFTKDIEDDEERFIAMRNLYEQAIRQFLRSVLTYAGGEFQAAGKPDPSMVAGSQMLNLWLAVSESTLKFADPKPTDEGEANDGTIETP